MALNALGLPVFEENWFWVIYCNKNNLIPREDTPCDFYFKFETPAE